MPLIIICIKGEELCETNFPIGVVRLTSSMSSICPEVNFLCSTFDFTSSTLRWFLDNIMIGIYTYNPNDEYPLPVMVSDATLDAQVGGVDIQIMAANLRDNRLFSTMRMTVNISAVQQAGVHSISCGDFVEKMTLSVILSLSSNFSKGYE